MCKQICNFLVLVLLVFLSKKSNGQTFPFANYTSETGLSQSQVLAVFQDDDGVMWFGTSGGGITKYDGNSYEYFTDKDGLADNVVFCIVKDKVIVTRHHSNGNQKPDHLASNLFLTIQIKWGLEY